MPSYPSHPTNPHPVSVVYYANCTLSSNPYRGKQNNFFLLLKIISLACYCKHEKDTTLRATARIVSLYASSWTWKSLTANAINIAIKSAAIVSQKPPRNSRAMMSLAIQAIFSPGRAFRSLLLVAFAMHYYTPSSAFGCRLSGVEHKKRNRKKNAQQKGSVTY